MNETQKDTLKNLLWELGLVLMLAAGPIIIMLKAVSS